MLKKIFIAPFAALLLAGAANAAPLQTLTLQHEVSASSDQGFRDGLIEVHTHRNVASVIATDALYGGIAGLAIGAGVALLQNDGNWGRDLAVGAGAGLLIGGVFGAVDAVAASDQRHPVGFGSAYSLHSQF